VSVTPPAATVVSGYKLQLAAEAVYSDGTKVDVTGSATWTSGATGVATVSSSGLVTAVAGSGQAVVSAAFGGKTGTSTITADAATLQSVTVTPADPVTELGVPVQFAATGVFSDGTRLDLTAQVAWASSNAGIATVSAGGLATPGASNASPITITATHGSGASAVSGSTTLTVGAASLVSITVTPATASVAAGTTAQFTATGVYTDGSTLDLTSLVTWSSSDPSVTLSNSAGSQGVATGVTVGSAQVSVAFDTCTTASGCADGAAVTVTSALLQSITLAPAGASVPVGLTRQLAATGHFSDGTTQDLTASAAWVTSDASVASVSNSPGTEGLATALAVGSVTVDATFASVTGSTTLTVSGATVTSIAVSPAAATVPKGYKAAFTAVATYSDASTLDVTQNVTWSSSSTTTATVSNTAGTQGVATGVAAGTATISARLSGVTGTAQLTVTNATLKSLAITPNPFTVLVGDTAQLTATGTFSDGSTLDVTGQVSWSVSSSSPKKAASVSRGGLVTGLKAGTIKVKAAKKNVSNTANGTVQ
jgi:hypothetical protein